MTCHPRTSVDEGFIIPEDISEQLAPPGETEALLPQNPGEWKGDRSTKFDSIIHILEKVDNGQTGLDGGEVNPLSGNVMDTIENYTTGYQRNHRSMGDIFFRLEDDDNFVSPTEDKGNEDPENQE